MIASIVSSVFILTIWLVTIFFSWRVAIAFDITRKLAEADLSKPRFQIVDFMALFMMLQLPMLMTTQAARVDREAIPAVLFWGGLYSLIYIGIWWWGAAALSAIQVQSALRRGVFLGLLQPLGILFGICAGLLLYTSAKHGSIRPATPSNLLIGTIVIVATSIIFIYACRWVRAGSKVEPTNEGEESSS